MLLPRCAPARSALGAGVLGVVIAALSLAGCGAVGPDYRAPEIAVPAAYGAPSTSTSAVAPSTWWRAFGDPALDRLEERALAQAPDVPTAVSRARQAHEQAIIAGATEYPTLALSPEASRTHLSQNGGLSELAGSFAGGGGGGAAGSGGGIPGGIAIPGLTLALWQLNATASWQLDIVGGGRRQIEAAVDRAQAAAWNIADAALNLSVTVANAYLTVRELQAEVAIDRDDLTRAERLLVLAQERQAEGLADATMSDQAQATRATSAATLRTQEAALAVAEHALAVALGQAPESALPELATAIGVLPTAPVVAPGLPSELLQRRPDLRASERQLAAASADIGVAEALLYPSVNLSASLGVVSTSLKTLFNWSGSRQDTLAGVINWPIFEGGEVRATIRIRKEADQQALLAYRTAFLRALGDVEDALTHLQTDAARRQDTLAVLAAQERLLTQARERAEVGLTDEVAVRTAEGAALGARLQAVEVEAARNLDAVRLVAALGGGWDMRATATGTMVR